MESIQYLLSQSTTPQNIITTLLSIHVVALLGIYTISYYWKCYTAPPGLWGVPFLGTLHYTLFNFLIGKWEPVEKFWTSLALKLAPRGVMSMSFGMQRFTILHTFDAIHEALVEKKDVFIQRPSQEFYQRVGNHRGIVFANGSLWKEQRRFALMVLRNLGFGKSIMEEKILFESQCLCQFMKESIGRERKSPAAGSSVNTMNIVVKAVSNIISQIVYGDRWDYHDIELDRIVTLVRNITQVGGVMTFLNLFFPILHNLGLLKFIPNYTGENLFRARDKLEAFLGKRLFSCKRRLDENFSDSNNDYTPSCYMEAFLLEMDRKSSSADKSHYFTTEQCIQTSIDLFSAGSDTTTNSISWALLHLARYPMIQARMYQEIEQILQENDLGEINRYELRTHMPYTMAVMDEVQRISSIVPRAVDKQSAKDIPFRGYLIRQNDIVVTHLHHLHHDPLLWTEPDRFDPDRFLSMTADGKLAYQSSKYLHPFGLGKRICLGESLARMEYFLFLSNLVRSFQFELTDETKKNWNEIVAGGLGLVHAPLEHTLMVSNRN